MNVAIDDLFTWAISLLGIFTTLVFGLVKLLLWQFEKRLDERFNAQETARKETSQIWEGNFAKVLNRQDKDAEALRQLENEFLRFKGELPLEYVRREDWVRGQSVIEAKLDGLALKFENLLLKKGGRSD